MAEIPAPLRRDVHAAAHAALRQLREEDVPTKHVLANWKTEQDAVNRIRYGAHLYSGRALNVEEVKPVYTDASPMLMGYEVINAAFDDMLNETRV